MFLTLNLSITVKDELTISHITTAALCKLRFRRLFCQKCLCAANMERNERSMPFATVRAKNFICHWWRHVMFTIGWKLLPDAAYGKIKSSPETFYVLLRSWQGNIIVHAHVSLSLLLWSLATNVINSLIYYNVIYYCNWLKATIRSREV